MSEETELSRDTSTGRTETRRVEAFSDGVLAVAITLLVLDLRLPYVGSNNLWHAITAQWPTFAAYATSFLVIGIMWINHHSIFRQLRFVDRPLMMLNLLLLLFIVAVPFVTSLVSQYLRAPGENSNIAMALYNSLALCIALTFSAMWGYALRRTDLLDPSVDAAVAKKAFPRFAAGALIYALLIGISFFNSYVALLITFAVALYYAFEQLPGTRRS